MARPGRLKPTATETRKILPFGSPRREGQHESNEAKRRRRSVGRLIDPKAEAVPVSIGIGAGGIVGRSGFRSAWTARHRPPPSHRQPRFEVRLNGFPEACAEVRRNRGGGGRRRVPDAVPTGFSDARFVVQQPAYSLGPHSVSPLRRLAGGYAPSDPRTGNGTP